MLDRKKYNRTYYDSHASELQAYARKYRQTHREEIRKKERLILEASPERLLFKLAKQRAKRNSLPFTLTVEYVRQIIPEICPITLLPFKRGRGKPQPQSMTLDKIIPSLGYVPGNVVVVSRLANTIKQSCADPEVFDRLVDYMEGV